MRRLIQDFLHTHGWQTIKGPRLLRFVAPDSLGFVEPFSIVLPGPHYVDADRVIREAAKVLTALYPKDFPRQQLEPGHSVAAEPEQYLLRQDPEED